MTPPPAAPRPPQNASPHADDISSTGIVQRLTVKMEQAARLARERAKKESLLKLADDGPISLLAFVWAKNVKTDCYFTAILLKCVDQKIKLLFHFETYYSTS